MHFLDFFSIIERDQSILNPSSREKLLLLADYCNLKDGARVLDIGSGKGYLLRIWAKRWAINGIGLELNPLFVMQARDQAEKECVNDRLAFTEGPALDFNPEPEGYDVVTCIGAPFALGSFDEAVAWMTRALKPTGVLALGDVYLPEPLPREVRERECVGPSDYLDLPDAAAAFEAQGLTLTGLIAASPDDWDRYASAGWKAALAWATEHPEHPDRPELLQQVAKGRTSYLRWQRRYLGWAIFVAQRQLQ